MNPYPPVRSVFEQQVYNIAKHLYSSISCVPAAAAAANAKHDQRHLRIVCISDTHEQQPTLPEGDVLIHAGDLTNEGSVSQIQKQLDWIDAQSHTYKVVIAGNHDTFFATRNATSGKPSVSDEQDLCFRSVIYLEDRSIVLNFPEKGGRAIRIYGSPKTPKFGDFVFQYPPKQDVWAGLVPTDVDILVVHTPPLAHLDVNDYGAHMGCRNLLQELWRTKPRLVVFGHVHESRGRAVLPYDRAQSAWEQIARQRTGMVTALLMLILSYMMCIATPAWLVRRRQRRCSHLVNAAVVGGPGNRELREPIVALL